MLKVNCPGNANTTRRDLQLHSSRELMPNEVEAMREYLAEAIGTPIALNLVMIPVTIIQSENRGLKPSFFDLEAQCASCP